jgi:hypothetical protein
MARNEERRSACRVLVGKPEKKRPVGRPRRRWKDNIKMDLQEVRWGGKDWIDLALDKDKCRALVKTVMNFRFPLNTGEFLINTSFSRRTLLHVVR